MLQKKNTNKLGIQLGNEQTCEQTSRGNEQTVNQTFPKRIPITSMNGKV